MPFFSPKRLFLIDGSGALLSAFFLAIVLIRLDIGMPKNILYFLAALPIFFAIYSFSCYFIIKESWVPYLKIVAFANLIYCCLTIGLVIYYFKSMTILGMSYFMLELVVVGSLLALEFKVAFKR